MATIKAYTDLEQSKVLSQILPLESADMFYNEEPDETYSKDIVDTKYPMVIRERQKHYLEEYGMPCWSLAVLLGIIPQEIFDGEYIINITEGCDNRWVLTYDHRKNKNHSYYGLSTGADNLIDACYNLILKLNERKML